MYEIVVKKHIHIFKKIIGSSGKMMAFLSFHVGKQKRPFFNVFTRRRSNEGNGISFFSANTTEKMAPLLAISHYHVARPSAQSNNP